MEIAVSETVYVGDTTVAPITPLYHATVRTFDFGKGLLLSEQVLKGSTTSAVSDALMTTYAYSKLGRKMSTVGPDNVQTTYTYAICNPTACSGPYWENLMYSVSASTPGTPATIMYNDHLDRKVQSRVLSPDTDKPWDVRELYVYDPLGRVYRTYVPYKDADGPGNFSQSTFDVLGRATQTKDPDNNTITFGYNGRTQWSKDARPNHVQTRTITNSLGKTWQVIQADGVACKQTTLAYTYFPDGSVQSVATYEGAALKAQSWFDYDLRGRKIASSDPDAGNFQYTYDALGQMKTQLDSRGLTTSFAYDRAGRLTNRNDPTVNATFGYDQTEFGCAAGLARGKRTSASNATGAKTISCFDNLGRAVMAYKTFTPSAHR